MITIQPATHCSDIYHCLCDPKTVNKITRDYICADLSAEGQTTKSVLESLQFELNERSV